MTILRRGLLTMVLGVRAGGRMAYTSGADSPSGDARIEAVKRQRVDSKLLGEFEWSLFQRAYDGVRTDVDRGAFHATAAAFYPTQGGFEYNGNVDISDVGSRSPYLCHPATN